MGSRHFANNFRNYTPDNSEVTEPYLTESLAELSDEFKCKIRASEERNLQKLKGELANDASDRTCVFSGRAGIAYLHYRRSKIHPERKIDLLKEAAASITVTKSRRPYVSFLCGEAGPLALGIVIGHQLGAERPADLPNPDELMNRLETLRKVSRQNDTADELLYGRAGYLFSLLFVNRETEKNYAPPELIKEVIESIIRSGSNLAVQPGMDMETPLLFEWHDSFYLGAAHGTAGILYVLLQAREYLTERHLNEYIFPTLDWLLTLRYESGNLPSSIGSHSDKLVQWCHGAPGLVQLCCLAYQQTGNRKYLDAALVCGEVVWIRGLCTKGYSICHGVAGNAYTFLQLYQITNEPEHLYRACCFTDWCINERPGTQYHKPDSPTSLFEGLSGRMFLIADIMNPLEAKFPAYTL